MRRLQLQHILNFLVACLLMCHSFYASAQASSDLVQKNREAMDAYANLEIEAAINLLMEAEQHCLDNNISGPQLARTFVNRGVVEMGGNGDSALAMEYFKKALCQDESVLLDPLNSTPDIADIFKGAQAQVDSQGCEGIGPPKADPAGEPTVDDLLGRPAETELETEPTPPPSTTAPTNVVNNVLQHKALTEQKKMVPIPFYVKTNSDLDVASVVTFYRTAGESIFQKLPMASSDNGWSAYIECDVLTTLEPSAIEYYIAVTDSSGRLLSTAGSEAQPFTIEIKDTLAGPQPTIPGEVPLPACKQCPPWNPECNKRDCKQYAELCSDEEPCCSGMQCVDGVCEESGGETPPPDTDGAKVRFFLNGGIGVGLIPEDTFTKDDFSNMRNDEEVNTDKVGFGLSKLHYRVGVMIAITEKLELGANFRGDMPLFSEYYEPLVPSVVANMGYRVVGSNAEKGFQMFAILGFGWVNIMHRIPFKDCKVWGDTEDGGTGCLNQDEDGNDLVDSDGNLIEWFDDPNAQVTTSGFRKAGYLGAEFGFDMNYWFARNLGLNMGTIFDVTFPKKVTVNLDIQLGLALRF